MPWGKGGAKMFLDRLYCMYYSGGYSRGGVLAVRVILHLIWCDGVIVSSVPPGSVPPDTIHR